MQLFYEPSGESSWKAVKWASYVPDVFDYLQLESGYLGSSDAMDFVPVYRGFWNCLDEKPPSDLEGLFSVSGEVANTVGANTTAGDVSNNDNGKVDIDDLLGGLSDSLRSDVGGQSFCSHCRCFSSGLVPLTDLVNFDPTFTRKGRCYQINCYSNEYLQVTRHAVSTHRYRHRNSARTYIHTRCHWS